MIPGPRAPGQVSRLAQLAALALTLATLTLGLSTPAAATQALSGREVQRRLRLADEAMESARNLLTRRDTRGARARLTEAERDYRSILEANPEQRDAAVGLSAVLFLTRRYEEGVRLLEPLRARSPEDHEIAHQLGLQLFRAGQHSRAIPLLEQVAADEGRFDACWLLAVYYYRRADWTLGLPHAERYARERPEDTRALGLLGTYYLKTKAYAQAVETLDRYLDAHPNNLAARINRANALFRLGDYERAATQYEALLAKHPEQMRLVYNLAAVRIKQRRCGDALPLLERFITHEPESGSARYFKADCLLKLGRYAEAERAFHDAEGDTATNPWIYHGLSRIALSRGHHDQAIAHARKAAEIAPEDWEILAWLGTVLRRTGHHREALTWHDRALELEAERARLYSERGRDLWALDRPADALGAFEEARRLDPDASDAALGAAAALTALGLRARDERDEETARRQLREALAIHDGYEPARVNLALMALSAGQLDEAAALLEASPASSPGPDHAAVLAMIRLLRGDLDGAREAARDAHGTALAPLLAEVDAHLAAARDDWDTAARRLDDAQRGAPREDLDRARGFAWFQAGLQRLARGDAAGARAALQRATGRRRALVADDRATLDFADAALRVVTSEEPLRATRTLATLLRGRRFRGKRWTRVLDIGRVYLAFGFLRGDRPGDAIRELSRVTERAAIGGAATVMTGYAEDLLARRAYSQERYQDAAQTWRGLVERAPEDIASQVNLAAARFMSGEEAAAAGSWRELVASGGPPEAVFNLGVVADRAGEQQEAYELYRRFALSGAPGAERAKERADAKARVFGFGPKGGEP